MGTFTLRGGFPEATEIDAYRRRRPWYPRMNGTRGRPRSRAPGPVVDSATMGLEGATFSGLPGRGAYYAAAEIGGEWRIVTFTVPSSPKDPSNPPRKRDRYLLSAHQHFPIGTVVGAYTSKRPRNEVGTGDSFLALDSWPRNRKPPGQLHAEATMGQDGALFEDIPLGGYVFAAEIAPGQWSAIRGMVD